MCVCVCVSVHVMLTKATDKTVNAHITGGEFSAAFLAGHARAHVDYTGSSTDQ